jgi:ABC-type multidrug transport system permease subunit
VGKRSRKRRSDGSPPARTAPAPAPAPARRPAPARESRSEAKNEAARAQLEPLAPGERPTAVTVGAVVATVLALGNVVLYLAGVKVGGQKPELSGIVGPTVIMGACAYGMWRAKYWAVLGMEALLGIVIVVFAVLITRAANLQSVAIALAVILSAGTLFFKLIKSMARIQMPQRPPPR